MAENTNNNQDPEKKPDKNIKPRFNTNWIFAILAVSLILFQFFIQGKQCTEDYYQRDKGDDRQPRY